MNPTPLSTFWQSSLLLPGHHTFDEAQKICPIGYRLPTKEEFEELAANTKYHFDKEKQYGVFTFKDGTKIEFPASGYRSNTIGALYGVGVNGTYWSSSPSSATNGFSLTFNGTSVNPANNYNRQYGFSVRCVKEETIDEVKEVAYNEQQLLFDALSGIGKHWNSDTLQLEDIEKDILVPENISIYRYVYNNPYGDSLFIGFNNNKQLLGCNSGKGIYVVLANNNNTFEKVRCKLIPCKREDLKAGDTAVFNDEIINDSSKEVLCDGSIYSKIQDHRASAYVIDDRGIEINLDNDGYFWYKAVSIIPKD
ncbi:MAG: fibrobacter succinogenes major paralogous domain-containing protein [Prevotella sp.]|jgi:ASC-1-like (ASCH) protein|nr:fibrobacter succinogenes major paralogous domain-containing protein [Prevotella sp.]